MAIRYARTNELGLVVPPPQLDCLQDACTSAPVTGRCFVDRHHLYFPRAKFAADPLLYEFAMNSFNVVSMPRCRHNSRFSGAVHTMFDDVRVPKREIMQEFLREAYVLREIAQLACRVDVLYESLTTNDHRKRARDEARSAERMHEFTESLAAHQALASGFEVVPHVQKTQRHVVGAHILQMATARLPELHDAA